MAETNLPRGRTVWACHWCSTVLRRLLPWLERHKQITDEARAVAEQSRREDGLARLQLNHLRTSARLHVPLWEVEQWPQ